MQGIIDIAESVNEQYRGNSIFETAENAGNKVWFRKLGTLKGFYICENNSRYIVINEELDERIKEVVCAHELGHDMLHREMSKGGIRESTLFLSSNKTEREANLFAADLLISDYDILSELEYCSDADSLAANLKYPAELVAYKLELLRFKGYRLNLMDTRSDFLH